MNEIVSGSAAGNDRKVNSKWNFQELFLVALN